MKSKGIVAAAVLSSALVTGGWLMERGTHNERSLAAQERLFDEVLEADEFRLGQQRRFGHAPSACTTASNSSGERIFGRSRMRTYLQSGMSGTLPG